MKFKTMEKKDDVWRKWFAWIPIIIDQYESQKENKIIRQWIWFCWIKRKARAYAEDGTIFYEYKEIK